MDFTISLVAISWFYIVLNMQSEHTNFRLEMYSSLTCLLSSYGLRHFSLSTIPSSLTSASISTIEKSSMMNLTKVNSVWFSLLFCFS